MGIKTTLTATCDKMDCRREIVVGEDYVSVDDCGLVFHDFCFNSITLVEYFKLNGDLHDYLPSKQWTGERE